MNPNPAGPAPPPAAFRVRDARPGDLDVIVEFNANLARETEGKALDRAVLSAGVRAALADPGRLRYWVAEAVATGEVVGQAAVTREWSDWRHGWIWWFQSVYVRADSRGAGVFRMIHREVRDTALALGDVIGLRLYVEQDNAAARRTYASLGFRLGGYQVYEEFWPDRFDRRPT